jgi:hypothetical protein
MAMNPTRRDHHCWTLRVQRSTDLVVWSALRKVFLVDRIKHRITPLRMAKHFVVDARLVGRILPSILVKDDRVDVRVQYCQFPFSRSKRMWSVHRASDWTIVGANAIAYSACRQCEPSWLPARYRERAFRCRCNALRRERLAGDSRVPPPSESPSQSSAGPRHDIGDHPSRIRSNARTNNAPIYAQCCAIGRASNGAAHVRNEARDLLCRANRLSREVGRTTWKNSFSKSANGRPPLNFPTKSSTPADRVGPGNTAFTVTPVPAQVSAIPRDTASCAVLVIP